MKERAINPYALWLSSIRGVGNQTIKTLLETASCAEEVYHMSEDEISMCLVDKLKRRGDATGKALSICFSQERDPIEEAENLRRRGIGFVSIEDDCFPQRLRGIPDCPYGLYYIRDLPPDDVPSVAIVGARNCSSYGREQARAFAEKLALNGISVVSGMARGVDGIAGRAAAGAGGRSYAVLGCGVDVVYPEENAELYDILKERGGRKGRADLRIPAGNKAADEAVPKAQQADQRSCGPGSCDRSQEKIGHSDHSGFRAGAGERYFRSARESERRAQRRLQFPDLPGGRHRMHAGNGDRAFLRRK